MSISRDDLHTLDLSGIVTGETVPHKAPGDVLSDEFMKPAGLSSCALEGRRCARQPQHRHHPRRPSRQR